MDKLGEILQAAIDIRKEDGEPLSTHVILEPKGAGPDRGDSLVEIENPETAKVPMESLFWAVGALCRRRKVSRCFVVMESTGRVCKTEAEVRDLEAKYGIDPRNIPADDLDRFLVISEVLFRDPGASRVARVKLRGYGTATAFEPADILRDHVCRIFHPMLGGYTLGVMPPGIRLRAMEDGPPEPPEPWDN
jgi:hypothetical protein